MGVTGKHLDGLNPVVAHLKFHYFLAADAPLLDQSMPGNLTFLQGCAASLVGQDVLVDTKALEAEPITVAGSTAAALGLTFVFVLPAAVLIAGAVVVLLRRRR